MPVRWVTEVTEVTALPTLSLAGSSLGPKTWNFGHLGHLGHPGRRLASPPSGSRGPLSVLVWAQGGVGMGATGRREAALLAPVLPFCGPITSGAS